MDYCETKRAIEECRRFMARAEAYIHEANKPELKQCGLGRLRGAMRRASLDASQALAETRKGRRYV